MKLFDSYYKKINRILTESNISEFNYGDYLFADPDSGAFDNVTFKKFLKKWSSKKEVNTEDEENFLIDLESYISDNIAPTNFTTILKALMPLKSKFPGILDPNKASVTSKFVYRGTNIPINSISKYTSKKTESYIEYDNPIKLKPKGTKGFISFSIDDSIAFEFATDFGNSEDQTIELLNKGLISVIICIPMSDPNLIMNPDFIKNLTFTSYNDEELETFYLGDSLTTSKILIPIEIIKTIDENFDQIPDKYKLDYKNVLKSNI
jgi:hypothetical protein